MEPGGEAARNGERSVLIVEDETLIAMMMAEALEESGYRLCGTAVSKGDALSLAAECPPSYAVVDIDLGPGRNGLDVGRELTGRGVTVLYATALGHGYRQEMEDAGGRACLQKPFAPEDVVLAIAALERLGDGQPPASVPRNFHLFVD